MRPVANKVDRIKEATLNLAQAGAPTTYDAVTAVGDVLISSVTFYVTTVAGGGFTSVSVQTNATTAITLMTAAEGAAANLLAQSHPSSAAGLFTAPWTLRSGQKIQYTLTCGALPTGEMRMILKWSPISGGAYI